MKVYVLDTDIMGFAFQKHANVLNRIKALSDDEFVTTIITLGEDLSGWLPACRRAQDGVARAKAYARLFEGFTFYKKFSNLPFDVAVATIFDKLKLLRLHVGTNDLSIAAITLSVGAILVTRNTRDFQRIADLALEDWTL
ncbi:MAG: type II toxin-antitoxin system VapC family toxin [Acidobacteria bacterium]|nr:type II toxin-antitoxin system VapC family toxin [Acidobacteriota bacterium]